MDLSPAALDQRTWPEVKEILERSDVALIPVGSTEQHGPQLPLGTDSHNVHWMCLRAAEKEEALVTPCMRFGVSDNHMDFPGTLNVEPETLIAVIEDLVASLHHHGFRRFLIVNGHGGNNATLDVAAIKLRKRFGGDSIIGHAYSAALGKPGYKEACTSGIVYHADEGETAKSLVCTPELVHLDRAVAGLEKPFTDYYYRYYHAEGEMHGLVSYGLPPTSSLTKSGVMGDATLGTREKGEAIARAAVDNLVRVIQDIKHTQVLPKFDLEG